MEINVRNANQMFSAMFWHLKTLGVEANSRNGRVMRFVEPVLTTVRNPRERVLMHAGRDANPVFHLMESIWMLAGCRDVGFLQQFNSTIGRYSDDGEVFNAAYGHRWRSHFGSDQLLQVIQILSADPDSRQAIIQMWDASDLGKKTLDKACNMSLVFEVLNGALNMTVINRSNDMWFGYCGANIVHMTVLQEFVASALRARLGEYRTFSTNLHLYLDMYDAKKHIDNPPQCDLYDGYMNGQVVSSPLMLNGDYRGFLQDCEVFCDDPYNASTVYNHPFFQAVAHPMAMISLTRRTGAGTGQGWAEKVRAEDWRHAAFQWIHNRELKKAIIS